MNKWTPLLILLVLTFPSIVQAAEPSQKRYYDDRGRSLGTASTDSQGTTTFRDARGRVVGKETKK